MIKAIVMDVDGTLATSNKEISPLTKKVLLKAKELGIMIVLASGRPTSGLIKYADELELDSGNNLLVSYNGAVATNYKTKEQLFKQCISIDNAREVLEYLKNFDVTPMIDYDDYLYVCDAFSTHININNNVFNVVEYEARGGNYLVKEVKDLCDIVTSPLNKILVACQPDYLDTNHSELIKPFSYLNAQISAPFFLEFTDYGVDKAKALNAALTNYNINADEVIAFGDGYNDLSIINYAGIGVAMANGVNELKDKANEVTLTNDEDGIAHTLIKYIPECGL